MAKTEKTHPGDRLFEVPLDQFTAERNALARELKGEEAKAVKAMRKPSPVAWAINQAVRADPAAVKALIAKSAELVAVTRKGHGDVRVAAKARDEALEPLRTAALKALKKDNPAVRQKVSQSLQAFALGDEAQQALLQHGRLEQELEVDPMMGFGLVSPHPNATRKSDEADAGSAARGRAKGVEGDDAARRKREKEAAKERAAAVRASKAALAEQQQELKRAETEVARRQEAADRAQAELEKRREAVKKAEASLAEEMEALEKANAERSDAEAAVRDAKDQLSTDEEVLEAASDGQVLSRS